MRVPMVYLWTRGPDVLYVGMTAQGLVRPLDPRHTQLRGVQPGDLLHIWRTENPVALEDAVLYHLRPRFNRTHAVHCPTCARYVGQGQPCREPGHAPDPSFFVPAVRINVARRPDHAVRVLRGSVCPETPTGAVLSNAVQAGCLERAAPNQAGNHRDDVAAGRRASTGPPANEQTPEAQAHVSVVAERWRQGRRQTKWERLGKMSLFDGAGSKWKNRPSP
jgi:hypothetical protein